MPKDFNGLKKERYNEILTACARLYESMNFKDITIKEISLLTSISRPSIYNYFETKEEIFLALFQREYEIWASELKALRGSNVGSIGKGRTGDWLARAIAETVAAHPRMLKLLSVNMYDMEENSRRERLTEFKRAFGTVMEQLRLTVRKFRPEMSEEQLTEFIFAFFPFMFGIYPYTMVTEKQQTAMLEAGIEYQKIDVFDLTYRFLKKYLQGSAGDQVYSDGYSEYK